MMPYFSSKLKVSSSMSMQTQSTELLMYLLALGLLVSSIGVCLVGGNVSAAITDSDSEVLICEYEDDHTIFDLWDPKPCVLNESSDWATCCVNGDSGPNICCSFFDYPGVWMWIGISIAIIIVILFCWCCCCCCCC